MLYLRAKNFSLSASWKSWVKTLVWKVFRCFKLCFLAFSSPLLTMHVDHIPWEVYHRQCSGLSLSSVRYSFSRFAVFWGGYLVFHSGYTTLCGRYAIFCFVYKIKPFLFGHMEQTFHVNSRTAANNCLSVTKVAYQKL